ncbi:MAG TPA: PilN domain-containing protein [Bdellovibrionota bacterium]|nr:PilN domain-containing protein [Bdellovibrionota bacterium]
MIRINLLPTKAARRKESVIVQLSIGAVAIALALMACWWINASEERKIAAKQAEIDDLNNKIKQLQAIIVKVDNFKTAKANLNQKINTIKDLNDKRSGPVKMLEEFTYVIPRKAWVTGFREVEKQLTLEGVAVDGPTVADFIDNLRGSKFFYNVQLIQVQQVDEAGKKVQRFNINCRVNYVPTGGKA